jgi:PucR C-terminal helix-turn-helix domain
VTVERVQEVAEALASRLRRSVAVDDHTLQLIAVSPDYDDADPARVWSVLHRRTRPEDVDYATLRTLDVPTRVAPRPELGLLARFVVPLRYRGSLFGFLWLIDRDDSLTPAEQADAGDAAEAIAALLQQRLVVRDRDRALATHLFDLLLDPSPTERAGAAAELLTHGLIEDDAHVGVLVVRHDLHSGSDGTEVRAAVHQACRPLAPGTWLSSTHRLRGTVLLAQRRPVEETLRTTAAALLDALPEARVGLGAPTQGLGAAAAAQRQASVALSVGESLGRAPGVLSFQELGPYALLGQLPADLISNDLLPLGLFNLLRLGAEHELLVTLEAFLDNAGDKQRAAQLLAVHRSTLYHRLDRIERISGLDLSDGQHRLLAHLAVKLHRLGRSGVDLPAAAPPPYRPSVLASRRAPAARAPAGPARVAPARVAPSPEQVRHDAG